MADRVIVVGIRRSGERLSVSEILQMVGRAGRKHDADVCRADVIVESDEKEGFDFDMSRQDNVMVKSSFDSIERIAFHLLPCICSKGVMSLEDAEKWYARSLAASQGIKIDMQKVIEFLMDTGAVMSVGSRLIGTMLGSIASKFYFHPADVRAWRDNFDLIFRSGLESDDLAIAWALGNVFYMRFSADMGKNRDVFTECKHGIPPDLKIADGTLTTIVLWWNALGGPPIGEMRNLVFSLKSDFGRIYNVLVNLDKRISKWDMRDFFDELRRRIEKGIPSHLKNLCRLPGINKSRALYLYELGVRSAEDIPDIIDQMEGEIDESFIGTLRSIVNEFC